MIESLPSTHKALGFGAQYHKKIKRYCLSLSVYVLGICFRRTLPPSTLDSEALNKYKTKLGIQMHYPG